MVEIARLNAIPAANLDPFQHVAYADQIEDNIRLKKVHYLKAINLYKNGCISDWHLKYVNCLISLRQYKSAYVHIGKYQQLVRGYSNSILVKAGNYHFKQKDYFIAIQIYQQMNNNKIRRKRLNLKIGICYKHVKKYNLSLKYLKKHLRQQAEDKRNIITYIHLADVYEHKSSYKKALNIYNTKLTAKDIKKYELFTNIGICYFQINDFEKSLFYLNQLQQETKDDINQNVCLFYKGYIYARKCEMFSDALKCFKCIDCKLLPSKHGFVDNELGYVYFKLNEFDLSLKHYLNYTKSNNNNNNNNNNKWFALVNIAVIYGKKGNHRQAFKVYKLVYSKINTSKKLSKSERVDLIYNKLKLGYHIGITCYNLGEYKLSLKNFLHELKRIKDDKQSIDYCIKLSDIYHKKLFEYSKAKEYYIKLDKLQEINKLNMELLYANCLQKLGSYMDAFKMTQRYLNKYPNCVQCLNQLVTLNMIGKLKYDTYCDELIQKSLCIDANSFYTNYIYAFHLHIIEKQYDLSKRYLNIAQSFINNRHQLQYSDVEMFIHIAQLYTLIDVDSSNQDNGELKSFRRVGMYYFDQILTPFADSSEVKILYAHFLCRFQKFELLDIFHTKWMKELQSCVNVTVNQFFIAYSVELNKVGRVDFAIEIINKIECKKSIYLKHLAFLYEMKKDYTQSLLYLKKSMDECMDCHVIALYANLLFKLGRIAQAVTHFKIAFNSKKGKYLDKIFVVNYIKAMCVFKDYHNCIQELLKIIKNNNNSIFIHQLIIEIYGKINYNCNNNLILKHLKIVYQANKPLVKHRVCCNLI